MADRYRKNEKGYMVLEAVIVYPILVIALTAFLYIALLFGQRAQLMAAGENTIIYIQSFCMSAKGGDSITMPNEPAAASNGEYNVYSNWLQDAGGFAGIDKRFSSLTNEKVTDIFNYYLVTPLMGSKDDIKVECTTKNYMLVKSVSIDVTYTKKSPISFSYLGTDELDNINMTVSFDAPIQDPTETIRNLQFVDYVLHKSGLDKKIDELMDKVKGFFKKS